MNGTPRQMGTLAGFIAIALWSSTIALSRRMTEELGTFTSAAIMLTAGGVCGLLLLAIQRRLRELFRLPRVFLVVGSLILVLYYDGLYAALGLAASREQVLELALVNYLWPALTLALSVPVQRRRARVWLLPGILLALAGVVLVLLPAQDVSLAGMLERLHSGWWLYLITLCAAIAWALYSNLAGRWVPRESVSAMPLFLLLSGLVMTLLSLTRDEHTRWTASGIGILAYVAFGPTLLGGVLWDVAMRRGRMVLLASVSYGIPLFSTIISSLYLGVTPHRLLWIACLLLITGAVICNLSVLEPVD